MSRLIDADELKRKIEHEMDMQDLYPPANFIEIIDATESKYTPKEEAMDEGKKNGAISFEYDSKDILDSICEWTGIDIDSITCTEIPVSEFIDHIKEKSISHEQQN